MQKVGGANWLWGRWSALGFAVAAGTVAIDQAHKWWMLGPYDIANKGRIEITPFFDLVFHKNIGISYSMFGSESIAWQIALAGFATLVSLGLWGWLSRSSHGRLMTWSLALIIGGAVGNAIDRVLIGGVADFFSFHIPVGGKEFYWYVFNIADIAIVAGVVGLLYDSWGGES